MLEWMGTPDDVLPLASHLSAQIYFIGIPGALIYNFAAAILRAYGDTKRPLIFLAISGVLNVFLNLFFVIVCELDVAGVAIATVVSQYVAVVLILICLVRQEGPAKLKLRADRKPCISDEALRMIARIGLPAGLAVRRFQHLQRHGAELRQLLRRGRDRREHRRRQHRRLYLHRP